MTHLHLALQTQYAGEDGVLEAAVHGFRVDVLRDGVVYEIQTGRLRAIRAKLEALSAHGPVVLVHPVMRTRQIVRVDFATGEILGERRSPKRGAWHEAFAELTAVASLVGCGGFRLELLLTDERETRVDNGRGSWRRRGVQRVERELVAVADRRCVTQPADLWQLLEAELPDPFTTADLAGALKIGPVRARQVAYTLRRGGAAQLVGRRARHSLYARV